MFANLNLLGSSFDISDQLCKMCEAFVCRLYGSKVYTTINNLRYHMFATKAAQGHQLPPTQDALKQHIRRANYQAGVWLCALLLLWVMVGTWRMVNSACIG